jgi:hypothetical protein
MDAMIVYLQQARHHRDQAERARRLAKSINTGDVTASLLAAAASQEKKAQELEACAALLRSAIERTAELAADLRSLCEDARSAIAQATAIMQRGAGPSGVLGSHGSADSHQPDPGEAARSMAQFPPARRTATG